METKKNTWIPVLSAVAVVLINAGIVCSWFASENNSDDGAAIFYLLLFPGFLLLLALSIIAIVLHNNPSRCNPVRERQAMLIIKIGLIPFYLLGGIFIFALAVVPGGILAGLMLAAFGWLVMLTGSVWAICYALSMKKAGMITGGTTVLFIVMEFFFVLDVVAAFVMFFLGRSREKAASVSMR